jgi:hypothetical protein
MPESPYQMTVDLNVLDHLGINLYSNAAAVLTEAVANAWDADAQLVQIRIDMAHRRIEIEDDGIGMTIEDMNGKYLRVGYRRRDNPLGRMTPSGRNVMGRKGLGKLSLFSIADTIEVQSAKDGQKHGLVMNTVGIKKSVVDGEQKYKPEELPSEKVDIEKGTKIVLTDIKLQRIGKSVTALRKRLARRFSIVGPSYNFEIKIDGDPITSADRGDLAVAQFLWYFGSDVPTIEVAKELKEKESILDRDATWLPSWKISGWIGTARLPKQLDSEEVGNLNGLVVFARGRLFHENILDKLNDGRLYTKYLTGQIEADFLDEDDKEDIATSDRQRVQEDDPRYTALISFLKDRLNSIESKWNVWRKKHEVEKARKEIPALDQWIKALPSGFQKSAETLVAKISSLPIEKEEDRRLMYRHAALAFERLKLRGSTEEFAKGVDNLETILSLLADRDALEASLYRDIVRSRLDAIKDFQYAVDDNSREVILQKYLFDHLWLLDPAWERAAGSSVMETRLLEEGIVVSDLTKKEELGRVDIAYRTTAGKHILVELKRAGRKMGLTELVIQGQKYVDKLTKILAAQDIQNPNIEVIFVIGAPLNEESTNPERLKNSMNSISLGSRLTHYDKLIASAQEAYFDYMTTSKELDKLEALVNNI